ncbi:MAG: PHP domain-containing protein [Armatimonadota bacterium]
MYEETDLHIHTHYLGCADETMTVPAIVHTAEELGLKTIAITDHMWGPQSLEKHRPIRDDLEQVATDIEVIFGVEADSCGPGTGEITVTEEDIEELGFELVVCGVHGSYFDHPDPEGIIELQQELMLDIARHPLVHILAHPWSFMGRDFQEGRLNWLTDMSRIPADYAKQLGAVAAEHNTAVEANAGAIWVRDAYSERFVADYQEYLQNVAAEGPKIAICSDAHTIDRIETCRIAGRAVREMGIPEEQLYPGD